MLAFPPSPNVGDSFEGWTWNGVKWACAGGDGGGFEWPPDGVTDGSNAATGKIGEVIRLSGSVSLANIGADWNLNPISEMAAAPGMAWPPGDWEITVATRSVLMNPFGGWSPAPEFWIALKTTIRFGPPPLSTMELAESSVTLSPTGTAFIWSALVGNYFCGPVRFNSIAGDSLYVFVTAIAPSGGGDVVLNNSQSFVALDVYARRVR